MAVTQKQRRVLDAVLSLCRRGHLPTVREIGSLAGLSSPATVQKHLEALEESGYIHTTGKSRGVWPLRGTGIPIVGQIAAGEPLESFDTGRQSIDDPDLDVFGFDEIPVEPALFRQDTAPGELVALRVKGDSMAGVGILDGDLVIIRRQPRVQPGEIAAVLIDGEGTLKRYQRRGASASAPIRLTPENERFEPIELNKNDNRDIRIFGRYIGLIRGAR